MILFHNKIPSSHIGFRKKSSQIVPEQLISDVVHIYESAIPYIRCQIQSTIQHEAAHRKDEEKRNTSIINNENVDPFSQFSQESRTEPIAESAEERCDSMKPTELSGNVVGVNLSRLFDEAKSAAKIDGSYRRDIRAGTLDPHAQGMYLMQDLRDGIAVEEGVKPNQYEGFDGTLWVDVRKIAEPFIVKGDIQRHSNPATYQDDGMQADLPNVSKTAPINAVPAFPFTPAVPAVPSVPSVPVR